MFSLIYMASVNVLNEEETALQTLDFDMRTENKLIPIPPTNKSYIRFHRINT